jgi:Sulfotransferase family
MSWKRTINAALTRTTGYRLQKADAPPRRRRVAAHDVSDRLVSAPAFVLSTVRSGSTLLRVLLDSHSAIHSPVELHLRDLEATGTSRYAQRALAEIGLEGPALQYLLWDRVLHRELSRSGKRILVNKTPNDVFIADRIVECWPDARFIYLLRHPVATARSRQAVRPQDSPERNVEMLLRYANALEAARDRYPGLTVRYEELTADAAAETRRLCEYLGVPWEPGMLEYGRQDHGSYRPWLGDWSEKIKSGRIAPADPLPSDDEIPPALRDLCTAWGYLPAVDAGATT